MKKLKENWKVLLIALAGIFAVILLCVFSVQNAQNRAFALEEQVNSAESDIKIQEKRRVDVMGDTIRLINTPDKGFIFVRYPSSDGKFIRANEILKIRRKKKMNEAGMNRELTPEERIEQLEKERAALELQIKNQEKYDEIRKIGDELALYMKALQDSGFSRDEAMQIFTITMRR